MYQKIWSDYLSQQKEPLERTLYMGRALRLIREQMRRSRSAVAKGANLGTSLLRHMELGPETHSTWEKMEQLSSSLGISTEKRLQRGREEFPYNFFRQTEDNRPHFEYDGVTVYPYSPPISSQQDFLLLKIELRPGKNMPSCLHPGSREIACYILDGPLTFKFGDESHSLGAVRAAKFCVMKVFSKIRKSTVFLGCTVGHIQNLGRFL